MRHGEAPDEGASAGEALAVQQWLPMLSAAAHRGSYYRVCALREAASSQGIQPLSDLDFRSDGSIPGRRRGRGGAAGRSTLGATRAAG